jgi:hypothetical protein
MSTGVRLSQLRHSLVQVEFRDRLGRLCSLGEGFPTDVPIVMLRRAATAEQNGSESKTDRVPAAVPSSFR